MKINGYSKFLNIFFIIILFSFVTGCGGGGGGSTADNSDNTSDVNDDSGDDTGNNDTGNDNSGNNSSSGYVFWTTYDSSTDTGSLYAINTASPQSSVLIDSFSGSSTQLVITGTYDSTNITVSNLQEYAVVYSKGGKLYKVYASGLTPIQVTNEMEISELCTVDVLDDTDFSNVENSLFYYTKAGADGQCWNSDDETKLFRLGMTATDSSFMTYGDVTTILDLSTGGLAGLITVDEAGKKVYHCDTNGSSCTVIASYSSSAGVSVWSGMEQVASNKFLMSIDGQLYMYSTDTRQLSAPLYSVSSADRIRSDGTNAFVASGSEILKVSGTGAVTQLVNEANGIGSYMELTSNRVVYSTDDGNLKSLPKTGGTAVTLASVSNGTIWINQTYGNRVFYEYYENATSTYTHVAGYALDDGTGKVEINGAMWRGMSWKTTQSSFDVADSLYSIFMVSGCSSSGCTNGSVTAYDPSTMTSTAIGTLPPDVQYFYGWGLGDWATATGYDQNDNQDIFFLNPQTANSLVRITDTIAASVKKGQGSLNGIDSKSNRRNKSRFFR